MANFFFGMNQSLDGYVDYMKFGPDPVLFRHFVAQTKGLAGSLYGRTLYEIMRYWDEEQPGWGAAERDFAQAWRATPKYVVSKTLKAVGPNATLISKNVEAAIRALKEKADGEIEVGGPVLAGSLTERGLIDEYRIYLHPVVLGGGSPFFTAPRPPLRLVGSERIGESAMLLRYAPG